MANISEELFMAILSMDSYNRGYNVGISGLLEGGMIGNATISAKLSDVSDTFEEDAQDAGFYAIAYTINDDSIAGLSAGQTVISYRGTDEVGDLGAIFKREASPFR